MDRGRASDLALNAMNYVFVLLMATAGGGGVSEAYTFDSLAECERARKALALPNAVCIQKEKFNIEKQMHRMIALMKQMRDEIEKKP